MIGGIVSNFKYEWYDAEFQNSIRVSSEHHISYNGAPEINGPIAATNNKVIKNANVLQENSWLLF